MFGLITRGAAPQQLNAVVQKGQNHVVSQAALCAARRSLSSLSPEKARWDGSGRWENLSDDFMHADQYGNCKLDQERASSTLFCAPLGLT